MYSRHDALQRIALAIVALLFVLTGFARADIRLPGNVVPLHYRITLRPDLMSLTDRGTETIDLRVLIPTRTIVLNAVGLDITEASLLGSVPEKAAVKTDARGESATFTFPRMLKAGLYRLRIAWSGKIEKEPRGLFYADYRSGGKARRILATQFESVDARRMFPCFDEPAYKATFQLTAVVPKNFLAVSNMPVEKVLPVSPATKRVRFYPTPRMSSYLVVFVAGDLKSISGESDGVKIRVIAPAGEEQNGAFALHWAEKVLHYYDRYYGVKYPLPKLDLIAQPGGFGGAMENWGGITFNEALLLFDPRNSSQSTKEEIAEIVAHEMAHQWTGDLVTMKWWDDLWLNEGFADWMSDKVTDHFFPGWHVLVRSGAEVNGAMTTDALSTTHPIERPVPTGREADESFDEITYTKAASIIRMLELYLGPENFEHGIKLYMKQHTFGNATSGDLWEALRAASGKPVRTVALGWIRQPGFPKVVAEGSCSDGVEKVTLTQKPFSLLPNPAMRQTWKIPMVFATLGNRPVRHNLLLDAKKTVTLGPGSCGTPVVFKDQEYYRVQYDPSLFHKAAAVANRLSPAEQTHLLFDTWAFALNGTYPASSYLDLIGAFRGSTDLAVWDPILDSLLKIDALEMNAPGRTPFRAYALALLRPVFAKLGWNARPGEDENTALLREKLIKTLGYLGDKDVIAEAFQRFKDYRRSPASLPSNLRPAVYRIVGRYADQATFDMLHDQGKRAETTEEKEMCYQALDSAQDPKLAAQALAIALSDEQNPVQATQGIILVAYLGEHPNMAWDFTRKNLKAIESRVPPMQLGFYVQYLIASFHGQKGGEEAGNYALKNFLPMFDPLIRKGLKLNALDAYLKSRLVPQVNTWISKLPGKTAGEAPDTEGEKTGQ